MGYQSGVENSYHQRVVKGVMKTTPCLAPRMPTRLDERIGVVSVSLAAFSLKT